MEQPSRRDDCCFSEFKKVPIIINIIIAKENRDANVRIS